MVRANAGDPLPQVEGGVEERGWESRKALGVCVYVCAHMCVHRQAGGRGGCLHLESQPI